MYTRSVPKEVKDMLRDISMKYSMEYSLVEDIFYHQFEFLSKMIERGDKNNYGSYENILLKQLGSFIANEKHINKLKDIRDAKQTDHS